MSNEKQTKKSTVSSTVSDSLSPSNPSTAASSPLLPSDEDPHLFTHLKIKRHSPKARIPTRGSALAAGYDLYRLDTVYLTTPETWNSRMTQRRRESNSGEGESCH